MTAFRDSLLLKYHHELLADEARVGAYHAAIAHAVKPGMVVVDLGAGTGLLSILAANAGAARVYAIEGGPISDIASELFRANGVADRVTLVRGASNEVELPEKCDLLVTETMGSAGLDEWMIGYIVDARARFLREGAGVLPRRLRSWVAPVESPAEYARWIDRWSGRVAGIDVSAVRRRAVDQPASVDLAAGDLAASPRVVAEVDFATVSDVFVRGSASFVFERACAVHGLALWFEADLTEQHRVANAPVGVGDLPSTTSWSQAFLALPSPLSAAAGQELRVGIETRNGEMYRWHGSLGDARFDQCSVFGALRRGAALGAAGKRA